MAGKQRPLAWIETTHRSDDGCTVWRIVVDEVVRHSGELPEDASGVLAFDAAQEWISQNQLAVAGWRHAVDRGTQGPEEPGRARTQSSRSRRLLLYGWAVCGALGGREAVCVTPTEMRALEDGGLPCPVCGDECSAKLEPTDDVKHRALAWNGKRWGPAPK